jgi:hypothetical protein
MSRPTQESPGFSRGEEVNSATSPGAGADRPPPDVSHSALAVWANMRWCSPVYRIVALN